MPGEREAFPGIAGAVGLVIAMWLAQVGVALILRATGADATGLLLAAAIVANALVTCGYILNKRLPFHDVAHPAPSSMRATALLVGVPAVLLAPAVFVVASFADDAVRALVPTTDADRARFEELLSTYLPNVLAVSIVGPVFEELLFRGVILRGLLARMAPAKAILLSALLFGIAHLDVYQFVTALIVGLPLGWLYVRFRSIVPGAFLHAAINSLSVAIGALTRTDLPASELPVWFLLASVAALVAGASLLMGLARLRQSQA